MPSKNQVLITKIDGYETTDKQIFRDMNTAVGHQSNLDIESSISDWCDENLSSTGNSRSDIEYEIRENSDTLKLALEGMYTRSET